MRLRLGNILEGVEFVLLVLVDGIIGVWLSDPDRVGLH